MTTVWIVFEIYEPAYSDRVYKNVDGVFLARQRADKHVEQQQERCKIDGLTGYSWEIASAGLDDSAA